MTTKRAVLFTTFGGIRSEVLEPILNRFVSEGTDRWPDRWTETVSGREELWKVLKQLSRNGFEEVTIQPLMINNGREYEKIRTEVNRFVAEETKLMNVKLGKPLLWDHKDMVRLAEILCSGSRGAGHSRIDGAEGTIYVAHGTGGSSDETFRMFERKLRDIDRSNVFVGTLKDDFGPERIAEKLAAKTVILKPLMLTAGTHAAVDLAGDGEDSWKSRLTAKGYDVRCELIGLGEIPAVRAMFLDHGAQAEPVRRNTNPLEALVLAQSEESLTQTVNSLGLDEEKILVCRDMRQALMIQELQNQGLFPECELEIVEGELPAVLAMIGGSGTDDCGEAGDRNEYGGLVCGYGDLEALSMEHRARAIFTVEEIVPPLGASSVTPMEGRAMQAFINELELEPESITSVYAEGDGDGLDLWAIYYDEETGQWWTDWVEGDPAEPELSGQEFAQQIRQGGQWNPEDWAEDDRTEEE